MIKALRKTDFLDYWAMLHDDIPLEPEPIPYKHEGTNFGNDTIRITGSRKFIDGVLSRLKELLQYEADSTRLQVLYQQTVDKNGKEFDSWNCYIQVHERGEEAQIRAAHARLKKPR